MTSKSSSLGYVLKKADPSTIQDKFLVGYQGWFTCPGDGEPVGPGHHGWLHWFNHPIPDGGRPNTDVWPDVSSYSPSELFPAPGLKTRSGEQTFLFSSRNPKTVRRHFHWMAEHGVDGAFLQRFAGQCDMESGNEGIRRIRDEVGERVREAAEQEGRVFAIMYDVSGVPSDRIQRILERDWVHLVRNLGVLDSPNYLREKGKAVIALWGFGFDNSGHSPALVRAIIQYFRNTTPGGVYIMGGAPTHWRTAEGDADRNPGFLDVWLNEFDAISPWTVGRYRTEQEADNFAETKMKGDLALIKKRNEEGTLRKIDYIPVVLPGGSGHNLSEGKWGFNDIKREGGRFLWKQIYNARRLGVHTIYGAMWDEYDEGTAFMPIVEHKRNLPESNKYHFLALDEDGYDVPSDWYMRICGFAAEGLRNERRVLETFPVKELQDYWSSRPRYEDVNPKSKESMSGSTSTDETGNTPASGGGVDPGEPSGGQAYQEWLALQKEEKDEVPPPPYTLEADESTDLIPSQAVTNVNARAAAVATTSEVPSVAIQDVPVVNVQPVASSSHAVASPPAVNNSTYPASAVPVSHEHAHSQVSAQSPQPSLPVLGQSPQPPSGLHHPQSRPPSRTHSPHPYPPPGTLQHTAQSQPPTQVHSPSPQPFPPAVGLSAQSHPPPAGTQHPQSYPTSQAQVSQPYPPAQSYHPQYAQGQVMSPQGQSPHAHSPVWGHHPQSHSPAGGPSSQGYPTSTWHSHGYPPAGVPPQGYIPPNVQSAQSRPTSGGPVHQGYPPADGSSPQGYTPSHNNFNTSHEQPHDPVATLASDFGRQNISRPSGGGGVRPGGRIPTPPPQHPARPANSGYPSRPPTTQPRPTSPLSLPVQETWAPAASTPNRPRWPPAEWDLDSAPVQHFTSHPGRRPSGGGSGGANLTRPQTYSASSSSTAGGPALRPTSSMNNGPPPRPNTASGMTAPSSHYPPPAQPTYNNMHDHSASSSYLSTGGPPMPGQHGSPTGFPAGPQYNPSYTSSSYYPGQQGGSTYGPAIHGSSYVSTSSAWPGSGRVSPPHSPPMEFPGGQMGYGSGVGGPQYPGGPPFPSNSSSPPGGVQFPHAPGGDGGYFGGNMPSSTMTPPFPNYGGGFSSSGSPYPQASTEAWVPTGPPIHPQSGSSSMDYPSPSGAKPPSFPIVSSAASGALGFALDTVDKVAGRRKRDQLESRVETLTQSSSKLFSKFTK